MNIQNIKAWAIRHKIKIIIAVAVLLTTGLVWLVLRLIRLKYVHDHLDSILFAEATNDIIDNLEGGYFHPNMFNDGRLAYNPQYSTSGETMYGIDRLNGGSLNTGDAGTQFWGIIDNAGAAQSWAWNYKGGDQAEPLKKLTAQIMQPAYESNAAAYLDQAAVDIIHKDKGLLLHFIYATWNGPGWFKKFATKINDAVASGTTDVASLKQIAVDSRVNSGNQLIAQEGPKITPMIMA